MKSTSTIIDTTKKINSIEDLKNIEGFSVIIDTLEKYNELNISDEPETQEWFDSVKVQSDFRRSYNYVSEMWDENIDIEEGNSGDTNPVCVLYPSDIIRVWNENCELGLICDIIELGC